MSCLSLVPACNRAREAGKMWRCSICNDAIRSAFYSLAMVGTCVTMGVLAAGRYYTGCCRVCVLGTALVPEPGFRAVDDVLVAALEPVVRGVSK